MMVFTRTYIAHAVGVLRKYISKLGNEHWTKIKGALKYFHGTIGYGLYYLRRHVLHRVLEMHGFFNVKWIGYLDHKSYTSGYVFNIFVGEISWMSKTKIVVSLLT